ncbi:MAG: HlyD family efflux transporter periplasmic adaptor subunit [Deltaproteobacteria bacterium]|nr:HlyD family efflux transporter periplasmic adaptor subunit [Deltaproteobacteria bacterium]
MPRRALIIVAAAALAAAIGYLVWHRDGTIDHYTGVVEGEERVIRAEVPGRVLTVAFGEGDTVPAGAVLARLDDRDIVARLEAKAQSLNVLDAEIARQAQQAETAEQTWRQDVNARQADLRQATSAAELAERTYAREQELIVTGASTRQLLDEVRAARDQANSARDRARDMLARAQAEAGVVAVAQKQLEVLRQQRALAERELAELKVTHDKSVITAPDVPTRVETQFLWPGELAQPGTPVLALLDPRDQYVQIYVPVADLARVRVGQRVAIELDSAPGTRVPGEISFIADRANFTPEKIETREDRVGQVYRAKVRILEGVENFRPGTEGNVYLDGAAPQS